MAENEGQEKTEQPTPKRERETREKGQIARSKELNTAVITLGGAICLFFLGLNMAEKLMAIMKDNFDLSKKDVLDKSHLMTSLIDSVNSAFAMLSPLFIVLIIIALLSPLALGGWIFSIKTVKPKFEKIDPIKGLKRIFSLNSVLELFKALAKFFVVVMVAVGLLYVLSDELLALGVQSLNFAVMHSASLLGWSIVGLSASLMIIAIIDVPYQLWDNNRKIKMSHQEIKDEMKETEGRPEVKQKIRQLQQEMAKRRMMSDVPTADVIITNPEHYAVALVYDVNKSGAPIVVAKGVDEVAEKIREVAEFHDVPLLPSPPLARSIYHNTELGGEIPTGLYIAVAQVLAYVYQLKNYHAGAGQKPERFVEPEIPEDLQR